MGYRYIHFGMGATEHAKRIDSYLTSERKNAMRISDIGKETGTIWSPIETESAKVRDRKGKKERKCRKSSTVSNNPDTD